MGDNPMLLHYRQLSLTYIHTYIRTYIHIPTTYCFSCIHTYTYNLLGLGPQEYLDHLRFFKAHVSHFLNTHTHIHTYIHTYIYI